MKRHGNQSGSMNTDRGRASPLGAGLLCVALLGLLPAGCVSTSSGPPPPPAARTPSKIDFAPVLAAARQLEQAQKSVLTERSKIQTAQDAIRLVNACAVAMNGFRSAVTDFMNYTPGLNKFNDKSAEARKFAAEMSKVRLDPVPGQSAAWSDLFRRFEDSPEMAEAKSNFIAAEEGLRQWLGQFFR